MPPTSPTTQAPPPRSLRANVVAATVGNLLFNLCRVGVIVLLGKLATADVLGAYQAALAYTAPVATFFMLQLRGAYVADVAGEFSFGAYAQLRRVAMGGACLVFAVIAIPYGLVNATPFLVIFVAVAASKVLLTFGELEWGVFQRHERLDLTAWSSLWRGLAILLPFAVLLPTVRGAWGADWTAALATCLYAVAWGAVVFGFDQRQANRLAPLDRQWQPAQVRRLAGLALPLGLVMLIVATCDNLPQLVIDWYNPDAKAALGYFGALANVAVPLNLLVVALGTAAANRVATSYHARSRQLLPLLARLIVLTLAVGAGLIALVTVAGGPLLRLLYTQEFAAYDQEFVIVAYGAACLFLASLLGIILTSMGRYWVQVPVQLLVLAATAIAAVWLIPPDPVAGGAWAFLTRGATQATLYALALLWALGRATPSTDHERMK